MVGLIINPVKIKKKKNAILFMAPKIGLKAIIEKYSKDFIEEGYKYIERSGLTTRVFAIQTDHISGKYQDSSRY